MRRSLAVAAATAALGVGLTALIVPSASAAEACPTGKYCLYDDANYTKLLIASDERQVRWIGAQYNDRVSSLVNNTDTSLHIHNHVNWDGYLGTVPAGGKWTAPVLPANVLSSYYLY